MSPRVTVSLALLLVLAAAGCSSEARSEDRKRRRDRDEASEPERASEPPPKAGLSATPKIDAPPPSDETDANTLVYLVSRDAELYSFRPRIPGMAAYKLVGKLNCKTIGKPVSMAVDRHGWAWVFYDSRELFKVSIADASCRPTTYVHPSTSPRLGMGFTADTAPDGERLFILSPAFGLASIGLPSLDVSKTEKLSGRPAELTGGGDGKLFYFQPTGVLSEIDRSSLELKPMHSFTTMSNVNSFAFARYAGRFYLFTSKPMQKSSTTEYDPKTNVESIRDPNIGIEVVGAGQSTLAPKSDQSGDLSGDFPPPPPAPRPSGS